MKILVQKFGGTSLRDGAARSAVIEKVIAAKKGGYSPVVVVSAMGRAGEPYATDTLIRYAREQVGAEIAPRDNDLLMSCGEIISAVIVAGVFQAAGYNARAITGWQAGIYTNDRFGGATYYEADIARLYEMLNAGVLPIVTGFQGITRNGDITTLGRGGSDTTAAILGAALKAEAIEIYTDVDGIMTADPRLLPEARVLPGISYNEVFQLADNGAKVIHPRAVEIAMRGNVPLIVRNTFGNSAGTRISAEGAGASVFTSDVLSGIACMGGRAQVRIGAMGADTEKVLLLGLAEAGISIDLINVFPDSLVFTVEEAAAEKAKAVLDGLQCSYTILPDCCKVSAIGARMRGVPGVMARIIKALANEGVTVLQTADSHMTISCLVKSVDEQRAVRALHAEFGLTVRDDEKVEY